MISISAKIQGQSHHVTRRIDPAQKQTTVRYDIPTGGTVYGAALNYKEELTQFGDDLHNAPYNRPSEAPVLYIKPKNTLVADQSPIPVPDKTEYLEVGAALGIVFDRETCRVSVEDALDYVAGYTIANDVSIPHKSLHRPAIKEKSRDGFCPIGPWIALRESVPNPDDLTVRVSINQTIKQTASTRSLVRDIPHLIADVSAFMTFSAGDVLLVGTPPNRPTFQRGDTVTIEIEGIGTLVNTAQDEREVNR
ncbi:5-carboxymethyl-2-oxo-hex-3- ene-1,7-dioate decarboxylase [Geomicrobium sp. JCM 19037]|uniref:fumarylacetoacetate hydrolase family protein n=1 Tax=Geomicrobium sp. JCM 19037 TaxID=1460634 RepID=UPI00045F190F|nr:fumarylacetoacetate hydrolase family protein [Geomicrobium sp. JCM 19037]GAK03858.1 5-carboxymethyl-2-oxo-hex-3- ene-1,7-dioate decarboxylase [Geomicrobium sp. JCM 19037]